MFLVRQECCVIPFFHFHQIGMHDNAQTFFQGSYVSGAIDSRELTGGFGTNNGRCGAWDFAEDAPRCGAKFSTDNVPGCIPIGAEAGTSKACGACFVNPPTFGRDGLTGCEIFAANPNNQGKECPLYIEFWDGNDNLNPACLFTDWDQESSWFMTLSQLGSVGPFLCVVSMISLVLFFVTSSDSGSLIVDILSANGRLKHSTLQRIFWAFTEGALATGLVAGAQVGNEKSTLQVHNILNALCCLFFGCLVSCFFCLIQKNERTIRVVIVEAEKGTGKKKKKKNEKTK